MEVKLFHFKRIFIINNNNKISKVSSPTTLPFLSGMRGREREREKQKRVLFKQFNDKIYYFQILEQEKGESNKTKGK